MSTTKSAKIDRLFENLLFGLTDQSFDLLYELERPIPVYPVHLVVFDDDVQVEEIGYVVDFHDDDLGDAFQECRRIAFDHGFECRMVRKGGDA